MWDISFYYVRLYDSQEEFKTGARKETCPEVYMINQHTFSDGELHCRNVGHHDKYNGTAGNTADLRRIVYAALHHPTQTAAQTSLLI